MHHHPLDKRSLSDVTSKPSCLAEGVRLAEEEAFVLDVPRRDEFFLLCIVVGPGHPSNATILQLLSPLVARRKMAQLVGVKTQSRARPSDSRAGQAITGRAVRPDRH